MRGLARALAMFGGLLLLALILLTGVSVAGRMANGLGHAAWLLDAAPGVAALLQRLGPVNGDFEIVEAVIAVAIMCFFPWCTLERRHASVDIVTSALPAAVQKAIDCCWDLLLAAVMALLTWRLQEGTRNKFDYGETTSLLEFPLWWSYAATTVAAAVTTFTALVVAWWRLREPMITSDDHGPAA